MNTAGPYKDSPEVSLAALWAYLSSWISRDGGLNGPVVHRGYLTRMFDIHDTAWTQQAVIQGLLCLYTRTGRSCWLDRAILLADAQVARQREGGVFRWSGHEDDRFCSLVHNAMADVALFDMAETLYKCGDRIRADCYVRAAARNLETYIIGRLYREEMSGFIMNPVDYYLGGDRFVVNMNSVAIEALGRLDQLRGTSTYAELITKVGQQILTLQSKKGVTKGSFPYAQWQPEVHIPLYTAITFRGYRQIYRVTGDDIWIESASSALSFLESVRCPETGFWPHKFVYEREYPYPIFAAGAGMIASAMVDAGELTNKNIDVNSLAEPFLKYQYSSGAIRNFIGYKHSSKPYRVAANSATWQDIYPTPSWNAQAFHFLSQVLPLQSEHADIAFPGTRVYSPLVLYRETASTSAIFGLWPLPNMVFAVYLKKYRFGLLVPGLNMIIVALKKTLMNFSTIRHWVARLRQRKDNL